MYEWIDPGVSSLATEFRLPFLDLRLLGYLLALPSLPWATDKGLMRVAMRGRLPRAVLERPKTNLPRNPLTLLLLNDMEPLERVAAMPELQPYIDRERLLGLSASMPPGWAVPASLRLLSLGYWLRGRGHP